MITNFLNKNDLGLNKVVKQTALATRTRARNVSLNKFRWNKNYLLGFVDCHIIHYPTPRNLTYVWSFGSLAGMCLVIQILSGVLLSTHYTANIDLAFASVEYIMRDVPNGWFIRYVHANGASMFFIVLYSHLFRGLYYGSYMKPRQLLWCSGVILFLLVMGTAFTGYVLPWGQVSFWNFFKLFYVIILIFSLITVILIILNHVGFVSGFFERFKITTSYSLLLFPYCYPGIWFFLVYLLCRDLVIFQTLWFFFHDFTCFSILNFCDLSSDSSGSEVDHKNSILACSPMEQEIPHVEEEVQIIRRFEFPRHNLSGDQDVLNHILTRQQALEFTYLGSMEWFFQDLINRALTQDYSNTPRPILTDPSFIRYVNFDPKIFPTVAYRWALKDGTLDRFPDDFVETAKNRLTRLRENKIGILYWLSQTPTPSLDSPEATQWLTNDQERHHRTYEASVRRYLCMKAQECPRIKAFVEQKLTEAGFPPAEVYDTDLSEFLFTLRRNMPDKEGLAISHSEFNFYMPSKQRCEDFILETWRQTSVNSQRVFNSRVEGEQEFNLWLAERIEQRNQLKNDILNDWENPTQRNRICREWLESPRYKS